MFKVAQSVYCAFCKIPRKVYIRKHIGWTNVVLCVLLSSLLMFVLWQQFNPKMFIFFVIFLSLTEMFIQLRWRMSITCKYCGFDPVLYLRDHRLAAERVKNILDHKANEGDFLLSSQDPRANLPKRIIKKEKRLISTLSKHV